MDITKEEKITRCIKRHPDWKNSRIANSTRSKPADVIEVKEKLGFIKPVEKDSPEKGLVSLEKVIERYDIKTAILKEIVAIPSKKLIEESELCVRAAGTDRNRFRRTVENNIDEFRPYRVKLKIDESKEGRWYWGSIDDVAEATRIRDL